MEISLKKIERIPHEIPSGTNIELLKEFLRWLPQGFVMGFPVRFHRFSRKLLNASSQTKYLFRERFQRDCKGIPQGMMKSCRVLKGFKRTWSFRGISETFQGVSEWRSNVLERFLGVLNT